jgi:hypothetical protein
MKRKIISMTLTIINGSGGGGGSWWRRDVSAENQNRKRRKAIMAKMAGEKPNAIENMKSRMKGSWRRNESNSICNNSKIAKK